MTHPQPNDGFAWTQAPWGAVLRCTALAGVADHFFTARDLMLRDRPEEWAAVAAHIGVAPDDVLLIRQVHGAEVSIVSAERPRPWPMPQADAIVSDDGCAAIAVRVADCVPVLMADERGRVVGAVHAGWRGIAARATQTAVSVMRERFGIAPDRLVAAVGPSIGPCCYEVGDDTRRAFVDAGHLDESLGRWFERRSNGKLHLDLWRAVADQLEGAGIPRPQIHVAGLCTRTHLAAFHSYRVDGAGAGRMAAIIRSRI